MTALSGQGLFFHQQLKPVWYRGQAMSTIHSAQDTIDFTTSANTSPESVERVYAERLERRQNQLANVTTLHRRMWGLMTVAGTTALLLGCGALLSDAISWAWSAVPLAVGLYLCSLLARNAKAYQHLHRVAEFYRSGLQRLRNDWQGRGITGHEFLPEQHVYARDLDLFGSGSLFELLCTARTGIGRATLAKWLLQPAEISAARQRQVAIAELRDRLNLREDWASTGESTLDHIQSWTALQEWASGSPVAFPRYARALAIVLPIIVVAVAMLAAAGLLGHNWAQILAVTITVEALFAILLLNKTRISANQVGLPSFELSLLSPLLHRLEVEHFRSPLLDSLRVGASRNNASKQIRKLSVLVWLLRLRSSEYFAFIASFLLWGTNFAIWIEAWRKRNRESLMEWLDSLGQFEAILCLSRYHYENPKHVFPELRHGPGALFHAERLGHPLLDSRKCVTCDLRVDSRESSMILVSGSNMSGKSTLLRSVGLNSVLALTGAPVRATHLIISPLQVGCSIAVHDSLLHGKSRFRSEVERLKWLIDLSREEPLLYLLDEALGGTNSNDRYWGAKAIIEQLVHNGAVGLVTTHDLALTDIVAAFKGHASNVHFTEHYANGEMRFDYQLRQGVVPRTNGLNVMAALGLLK
jgi:hypothetical protein